MIDRVHNLDAREITFDRIGHRARVHLVARKAQPRRPTPRKDHAERARRPKGVSPRADLRRKRQRRALQVIAQRARQPLDVRARKRICNVIRIFHATAAQAIEFFVHVGRRK